LSKQEKLLQLANAEEHLRRAIIEPYDLAVANKLGKVTEKVSHYERAVLPVMHKHNPLLSEAPTNVHIQACIKEVQKVMNIGRDAKRENAWNEAWENGVRNYINAYDVLDELGIQLDKYIIRTNQLQESWRNKIRNNVGVFIGIAGVVIGIVGLLI
jgi:hypothetical protein